MGSEAAFPLEPQKTRQYSNCRHIERRIWYYEAPNGLDIVTDGGLIARIPKRQILAYVERLTAGASDG